MKLSTNFSLDEFVNPDDPVKPDQQVLANLTELAKTVLEPLREAIGKPIKITSGYRSPVHNKKIGGAKGSTHCLGIAADIHVPGTLQDQIRIAKILYQNPNVGGIGLYATKTIVHVDIREWIGNGPGMWIEVEAGLYKQLPPHIKQAITGRAK